MLNKITPIEKYNGYYLKRDDLFIPFGVNKANGGKLRQAMYLISKSDKKGVITGTNLGSPQSYIVSSASKYYNKECIVYFGGTNYNNILCNKYPNLSIIENNAIIKISKSGRNTVLRSDINKFNFNNEYEVIEYGMFSNDENFINITANQTKNLIENIPVVATCGSGNTAKGIIKGIKDNKLNIGSIILIGTAPNRLKKIEDYKKEINSNINIIYYDLFNTKNFNYNKECNYEINGILLHPKYEAKTFQVAIQKIKTEFQFWIVGADIIFNNKKV